MANRGSTGSGGRNDPGQRGTKAERKEQARLERERIQAQMRARHRNRNIGLTLVALAVVVVVVAVFAFQPKKPDIPSPATLLEQAKTDAGTAVCDAPKDPGYYDNISHPNSPGYDDRTHIGSGSQFPTMPPLSTYPSAPPASGPHNPTPLPHGVYDQPPPIDQAIHSLEHAGVIIWYRPGLTGDDLDVINQIKAYYQQSVNVGQSKVIVAPYSYPDQGPAGQLADGVGMALVAWHTLQTCTHPSLAVAFNFTAQYSNVYDPSLYIGQAPEPTLGIDPA